MNIGDYLVLHYCLILSLMILSTSNSISCQHFECGIQLDELLEVCGRSLRVERFQGNTISSSLVIVAGCLQSCCLGKDLGC